MRLLASVVVGATLAFGVGSLPGAGASDPTARLAELRRRIDDTANRWFAAQAESARLDAQLADLDATTRSATARIAAGRADAVAQAAALYLAQPEHRYATPAGDTLDSARDSVLRASANEHTTAVIGRYVAAVRDLDRARSDLEAKRRRQRRVVADLAAERARLDRDLAATKRAWADAQAAARANPDSTTTPAGGATGPEATTTSSAIGPTGATGAGGTGTSVPSTTRPPTTTTAAAPPPPSGTNPHHDDPFLSCVRRRESHGYYGAVNPGGYYGAYQFARTTWNVTASHAGRPDLVGVRPDHASAWDQDQLAWVLYQWQGMRPWGGGCG